MAMPKGQIKSESEDDSIGRSLRIILILVVAVILLAFVVGIGALTNWFGDTDGDDDEYEAFGGPILNIMFRIGDPSTLEDDLVEMDIKAGPVENVDDVHLVFFYGPEFNATRLYEDFNSGILRNTTVEGDVSFEPPLEDILLSEYTHTKNNTYLGIELQY
jgi:hypothetical protein